MAGALSGFLAGLSLGWSRHVRYWGQPVLKTLGPIPATAWIPLAMVLFPTSFTAGAFLVALASFFPMTVLTSSGIASVRQSHLDVARMLGATQRQLIWRIAIPSALPTILSDFSWVVGVVSHARRGRDGRGEGGAGMVYHLGAKLHGVLQGLCGARHHVVVFFRVS